MRAAIVLALLVVPHAACADISDDLARMLETTGRPLPVVLTLRRSPAQSFPDGRVPVGALKDRFRPELERVARRLRPLPGVSGLRLFPATGMIAFRADPAAIREIAADPGVDLDLDAPLALPRMPGPVPAPDRGEGAGQGLALINAPRLWELGYTGRGVTVMTLDTGVDIMHPALARSWRGNRVPPDEAWFDPVYGTAVPQDYAVDPPGHGTMTMGLIVGMEPGDTVGVAFDAEWIAAGDSAISISTQVSCLEWALDPDGDPATTDDMPDVVNCSWTRANPGCKTTGLTVALSVLEAAGIAVVFSAGNDGPDPGSVRWPARMNTTETDVFSVGFIDGHDPLLTVAPESGRGPTPCEGSGNAVKPEVTAPGREIRTTWLRGEYATGSGTSFSAPYVSGALALLKQAFPHRSGAELKMLLIQSARDLGAAGEDNDYGSGLIDVWAAYQLGLATAVTEAPGNSSWLAQNFPNPFNPLTHIPYGLATGTRVRITIHSLLGLEVARPVDGETDAGRHVAVFSAEALPSGVYICRMATSAGFRASRRMLLVR